MKGLVNAINAGHAVKETGKKLMADMFDDIDERLNRKNDDSKSRCLYYYELFS